MRANLAKRRAGLIDQQVDYMSGPLFAQGAKTPQECLAGKCRLGTERQRPGDIRAAAHAAVEDDGRPMTYLRHDGWQDVDRCRQRLNLSPSMIRDPDAVYPKRQGLFCIRWMHDALEHKRPFPPVAETGDFLPCERAAHFIARKPDHVVEARPLARIGPQVGKARVSVLPQRIQPARRTQHVEDHAQIRTELSAAEADHHFTWARGAHRHVHRHYEHMHACRIGATHDFKAQLVIIARQAIELKPQYVGRDRSGIFDREPADRSEHIGHTRSLRGLRHITVRTGPDQRRTAHRRNAERRRIAAAEKFDADRRQRRHHAITRHQFDRIQRCPIARDALVGACTAVAIFKGKIGNVPARAPAQIVDRWKPPAQCRAIAIG